jgi:branched-chain amino acid transport system permease protein
MLVVGGIGSLWGAVVGALLIAGLNAFLAEAQRGITLGSFDPGGTRLLTLGVVMLVVVLFKPSGLTGSRELTWPFSRSRSPELGSTSDPLASASGEGAEQSEAKGIEPSATEQ